MTNTLNTISQQEINGFVLYLTSTLLLAVYLGWGLVPDTVLAETGVSYYPSKQWAVSVPVWLLLWIPTTLALYTGINLFRTPSLASRDTVTDDAATVSESGLKSHLMDTPIVAANRALMYSKTNARTSRKSMVDVAIVVAMLAVLAVFIFIFGESQYLDSSSKDQRARHIMNLSNVCNEYSTALEFVLGKTCMRRVDAFSDRMFYSRHPLIQIFYLVLVTGSVVTFLLFGWNKIPNQQVSPAHHRYLFWAVSGFCYYAFLTASWSNPGYITSKNVKKAVDMYDHDYLIYSPKHCQTCLLDKPARSKHCSLCKHCIAKCDHHCAWINNCVGHANYPLFLRFLAATVLISFYMSYLSFRVLQNEYHVRNVANLWIRDETAPNGGRPLSRMEGIFYVAQIEPVLVALSAFAGMCGVVVTLFLGYQIWTVGSGKTTNEVFKWEDLDYELRHGVVTHISKKTLEHNRNYGKLIETVPHDAAKRPEKDKSAAKQETGLRNRKGALDANGMPNTGAPIEGEDQDVPFTSIEQVRNIYDRGFIRNVWDVVFPSPLD
ncbi:phosphatidylinositol N-acetylglucosaminyltransferase [Chytriomyces confervae]|uniref:Palmitoyltransferase n=1 Tax=Chytriomyces confervae TaxID=246404 RepID=A0A507FLI9_9FUNG|nr:phosphatidylinositol N-acetylglucosaminyltransferase [Chytriomyces confervae]